MGDRFMRKGTAKFYFVPTIALASTTKKPTVAEIAAGVKVSPDLATINGFSFSNSPIKTPDMESTYTKEIGGEDSSDDSSMDFYERKNDVVIYDALEKDTAGFMVIFPQGIAGATPAIADICDVWQTTVTSRSRQYTTDNEAAKFMVNFSMTDVPKFDLAISA